MKGSHPRENQENHPKIRDGQIISSKSMTTRPGLAWGLRKFNRSQAKHLNHFANVDKPNPKDGGMTSLTMCKGRPENVDLVIWQKYYDVGRDESRGLLSLRVWQVYQEIKRVVYTKTDLILIRQPRSIPVSMESIRCCTIRSRLTRRL